MVFLYSTSKKNTITPIKKLNKLLNKESKINFINKGSKNHFWIGANNFMSISFSKNNFANSFKLTKSFYKANLSMLKKNKDSIFIGSVNGLFLRNKKSYKLISNIPKNIEWIQKGNNNNLWLATSKGLCKINTKTKETIFYGNRHGLNNENTYSIITDTPNSLWVGTAQGISKFDIDSEKFTNYTYKDGFEDNSFIKSIAIKLEDGSLLFGGTNGLLQFHPDSIKKKLKPNKVVFTKIRINNKKISKDNPINLKAPIEETKEISLSHQQKVLTLNFTSFNYKYSKKNKILIQTGRLRQQLEYNIQTQSNLYEPFSWKVYFNDKSI